MNCLFIFIFVFNVFYALHFSGFTIKRIVYILFSLCFIFLLRNYVCIAILLAGFAWIVSYKKKYSPIKAFTITYLLAGILFFNLGLFSANLNLPQYVSKKQWDFGQLEKPQTYIEINTLQPAFRCFALNAPQALNHTLLRPYLWESHLSRFLLPLSVELFFYQALFFILIFCRKNNQATDPFILFGLFFSFSILLIIGYCVPVIGAIVRYRSIYLPFILSPVLCNIDWKMLRQVKIKK